MTDTLTATDLRDRIDDADFELVDTRLADDFAGWHIDGAVNYPYKPGDDFDPERFKAETGVTEDDTIYTICAKGISSNDFADVLDEHGFDDVTVVSDGMQGWSAVYDVVEIPTASDGIEILQIQRRAKGCLGYLVGDVESREAAVIDASRHTDEFVTAAEERGYTITHVFDTHVHADHVSGGRNLADEVGATYHLGADARDRGVEYAYDALSPNEVVRVGDVDVKALATPGHTSEMVSYLVDGEAVMTGDSLFVGSVGRTELQFGGGGAADGAHLLYRSLHRTLLAEPDSVTVLPGHFALSNDGEATDGTPGEPISATVGELRTGQDLLQVDEETFVSRLTDRLPEKPPNYETVIDVNTGRRRLDDEQEATELELGPNRCAASE
ncbi:thiosulfate/3-mercaptopyruvate sulfurtransferase [Halogranum gelatinilyticum]|uniref:Thiosulfate/3-mercaptopyruvate sulfurtransferase n=1 Tax=Halogranum gelatinilyticum TaxID=660521 RepID=A0A1G9U3L6_9EURY|nr:rhodanese-like domain-containing protein [Halogranum gelatinilyticum]SDM54620.1 thiosulfate/3-mercaptopyruvate sulfurtransferase [Halogranum gelatinilyticum]